jgi:diadenylate cyclase
VYGLLRYLLSPGILLKIADILLVILVISQLFKLMRGTKGIFFLNGIVILFLLYGASDLLKLKLFSSMLQFMMIILIVALPIIFQNELKRALEMLGRRNPIVKWLIKTPTIAIESIEVVAEAADSLSKMRIGALIVLEREDPLLIVHESGSPLDALLTRILLEQLFYPNSPLHDGAVLIKGSRVQTAGCFLPLDNQLILPQALGSRHRAGLTLSTQSDALVVIVSEETGGISLAYHGILESNVSGDQLKFRMKELIELSPVNTKAATKVGA